MEHRRRSPRGLRWTRRSGVTAGLALTVALLTVLWLTFGSPGGTRNAAGSVATSSATSSVSAGAVANASGSATASASASTSASASPSPSASPSASKSRAGTPTNPALAPQQTTAPAGDHLITIVNAYNQTIWAATNPNAQHPIPVTGWKLAPGQSVTFTVPAGWGGRVWGRTGCSFDSSGAGHCQSGDCGGVFQCQGTGGTPTTLAELTLDSFDGLDFYDVSLVDGSNLPMYINTTHRVDADPISSNGCYKGACTKPIVCPSAMQVKAGGQAVACETACAAFNTDAYCCRGSWSGRTNCDPTKWPIDYARLVFKDAEPYAYSYAYDDSATMACKGGCYYRITFGVTP